MFWMLLACSGKAVDEPAGVEQPTPKLEPLAPVEPMQGSSLRMLLKAWHSDDVPGREVFDAHEDAVVQLMELARDDAEMIVRERAMLSLSLYPESPEAKTLLVGVVEGDEHAKLRAAALRGLGGWKADADVVALAESAKADADPRVQAAAAALLE